MSRTNETRHIEWIKTCKCKCRLNARVCNNKRRWNGDNLRFECKELNDKEICDKGFIWNPDIGEYLDYRNCKCRNKLIDKLIEECSENIDENEMIHNEILNVISLSAYKEVCGSCPIYIVLFAVFFITSICISSVFIYFHTYSEKVNVRIKFNPGTQTTIY